MPYHSYRCLWNQMSNAFNNFDFMTDELRAFLNRGPFMLRLWKRGPPTSQRGKQFPERGLIGGGHVTWVLTVMALNAEWCWRRLVGLMMAYFVIIRDLISASMIVDFDLSWELWKEFKEPRSKMCKQRVLLAAILSDTWWDNCDIISSQIYTCLALQINGACY